MASICGDGEDRGLLIPKWAFGTIVSLIVTGLINAGVMWQVVRDHDRRVEKLEAREDDNVAVRERLARIEAMLEDVRRKLEVTGRRSDIPQPPRG